MECPLWATCWAQASRPRSAMLSQLMFQFRKTGKPGNQPGQETTDCGQCREDVRVGEGAERVCDLGEAWGNQQGLGRALPEGRGQ